MTRRGEQGVLAARGGQQGLGLSALAMITALIGTLVQATEAPVWRADAALLSGQQVGSITGRFFPFLSEALTCLPLGSRTLRAALIGALASAIFAAFLCQLIECVLAREGNRRRMDRWLALAASLSTVFSFPFITDATIAGGGSVPAAALSMGLLYWSLSQDSGVWTLEPRFGPRNLTEAVAVGGLWGLLLAESPWSALALGLVLAPLWHRPERRAHWVALGASGLVLGLGLLGARALALTEGEFRALALLPEGATWPPLGPLAYLDEVGLIWAGGVVAAVLLPGHQVRLLFGCLTVFFLDLIVPAEASGSWLGVVEAQPSRGALHLQALGALALLGAVGLRRIADLVARLDLLASAKSAALLTLLPLAAAIAGVEDASRLLSQTEVEGPGAWTAAALHPLPRGSVVLTHTPAVSFRLRAAQKQGERPDVLVVPLDSLAQAGRLSTWLIEEPALKQLIVDMSVDGTPSERALSLLSDQRSIFVEPDPTWDRRLLAHLSPTLPLARFSPHAIGRSDRISSIEEHARELARIFQTTEAGLYPDHATRRVLARGLEDTYAALDEIGDEKSQHALIAVVPPPLADLARLPRDESPGGPTPAPGERRTRELVAR